MDPPNSLCAKCFNKLALKFIVCHVCRAKYHFVCVGIEEKIGEVLISYKNLVFNCNTCLCTSSDLISQVSSISTDLRELKKPIIETATIIDDVKELKHGFNELVKNLETQNNKNKMHLPKQVNARPNALTNQRSFANVVVGNKQQQQQCDDASSVTSFPTAVSQIQTDYDTENQENGFSTVRRRKRRNRVIVVGERETEDLAVAVKKKYLHISSLKPSVTSDDVLEFIEKNTEIGKQHLECTRLVKKDVDVATLKHVNFKLGVSPCFYNEIIKSSLWPANVRLRPFVFFPRNVSDLPTAK